MGCNPNIVRNDATIDADAPNQSLVLSVNGPLQFEKECKRSYCSLFTGVRCKRVFLHLRCDAKRKEIRFPV